MPIRFRCPSCQQRLGIATRKAGQVVSCPRCGYPATVPMESSLAEEEDDDATAAFAEDVAPPPPKPVKKPIFERKDFDEVINGPAPPAARAARQAAASGGVATAPEAPFAPPPMAAPKPFVPPPLPSLSAGKPAAPAGMPTALALGLAAAALILGAGVGFIAGRESVSARGAAAPEPAPKRAAIEPKEPAPPPKPEGYRLRGVLTATIAGKDKPDAGARVLVFPLATKPLKPFGAGGLAPGDENNPDRAGLDGLERIQGAAATADADGRFEATVERPGKYWVLAISAVAKRPKDQPILADDRSALKDYFASPEAVIGERQLFVAVRTALDEAGEKKLGDVKTTFRED